MGCTIATPPKQLTGCAYCKQITLFIGYAFCQVCIGATVMLALCYSAHSKDYHVAFCTLGWQLLMAEGTLIMVYTRCNPLLHHHRRSTHMFIQILGLIFLISGSVLVLYIVSNAGVAYKVHGWIGVVSFVFTLISALAGPIAALKYQQVKIVHAILSIPTLLLSTLTFFTGILGDRFKQYIGSSMVIAMMIMSTCYLGFLIFCVVVSVLERLKIMKKPPEPGLGDWIFSSGTSTSKSTSKGNNTAKTTSNPAPSKVSTSKPNKPK